MARVYPAAIAGTGIYYHFIKETSEAVLVFLPDGNITQVGPSRLLTAFILFPTLPSCNLYTAAHRAESAHRLEVPDRGPGGHHPRGRGRGHHQSCRPRHVEVCLHQTNANLIRFSLY